MFIQDDSFDFLDNVDITKINLDVEHKYLDRQVIITLHAADDLTFKHVSELSDKMAKIFEEAIRQLKALNP